MTEFDAVTARGLRKMYGSGVVVDRPEFDSSRGEMADPDGAAKTITVGGIQRLHRLGGGALRVLGYHSVTWAAQLRPLIGGQLQDSALPDQVARALDLFATSRTRDGSEPLEQFGRGERGRRRCSPLAGRERQRLLLVLALPGRPGRTS